MADQNLQNEHKVLAGLVDTNDDLWRPLSLAGLLSITALPMALLVTMALWWFELIASFWWWFTAIGFGSLAAVWGVFWLLSYGIGVSMLGVKLSGARAAMAYNRSLQRLANEDMNRPLLIEPDLEPADVEIIEAEPPIAIGRNGFTEYIEREAERAANLLGASNPPRLAATVEHSVPAGLSRRQAIEAQHGVGQSQPKPKPTAPRRVLLRLGDGVSIDKRDIVHFIEQAFTVGVSTTEWRKRFNQNRYTHELEGKQVQSAIFGYLAERGALVKAGNRWALNPDYTDAKQALEHLKLSLV